MRRWVAAGLAIWVVVLVIAFQPHSHTPPVIHHARLLEPPDENLPTLAPLPTTAARGHR